MSDRYYVKVVNGVVVDGPRLMSSNISEAPNTNWQADQMKRWDFIEVDISCDKEKEFIDYANPVVNGDSVTYNRIQLNPLVVLQEVKKKLVGREKANLANRIYQEFDREEIILIALGVLGGVQTKARIQNMVDAWQDYKQAVNNSTTVEDAKACVVNWP